MTAPDWQQARFPELGHGYESYYLRAVDPERPRSVWLRHTVSVTDRTVGSIWVTLFDAEAERPAAAKWRLPDPSPGAGLTIGRSTFGPGSVRGDADGGTWDVSWEGGDDPVVHLPRTWMYRSPLPRTKAVSLRAGARFRGRVEIGGRALDLRDWPGMVGHNWGAEHAERWIWLHGIAFEEAPDAWIDLAIGRVRIGRATTPWVANGVVSVGGRRHRLGGLGGVPSTRVVEDPLRLDLDVPGRSLRLEATVHSRRDHTVVWRYADADASEHHVANCSIAGLELVLRPDGGVPLHVSTGHGCAYELGMRETGHGLPVLPFPDF